MSTPGRLFVVSTPIGNMGDFSFRAVEILRAVTTILAEDTRHSRRLLDRYEIRTPTTAYHEHNEARATPKLIERLVAGEDLALISDAGTPLLSDPGHRLVQAAVHAGVPVLPIPGASAVLSALVASGLSADRFTFYGFLPRKQKTRREAIEEIAASPHTSILYEAPARVAGTLRDLADGAGDRAAVVARELTKQFEEVRRGTVTALAAYYSETPPRGEVVILLAGAVADDAVDEAGLRRDAARLIAEGMSVRDAAAALVKRGAPRNLAYRLAQDVERDDGD